MAANNTYSLTVDGNTYTFTIGWSYADFLRKNSLAPNEKAEGHFKAIRSEAWAKHAAWSQENQTTVSMRSGIAFNRKAERFVLRTIETREGGTPDKASVMEYIGKAKDRTEKYLAKLTEAARKMD